MRYNGACQPCQPVQGLLRETLFFEKYITPHTGLFFPKRAKPSLPVLLPTLKKTNLKTTVN